MQIFISHNADDIQVSRHIMERLRKAGHEVWADALRIEHGVNFSQRLKETLASFDAILVLISADSLRSEWQLQQLSLLALSELTNQKPKIFQVIIDSSTVPSYVSNSIYIDMSENAEGGINTLIQVLNAFQGEEIPPLRQNTFRDKDNRNSQIARLRSALDSGRLTLILGAGCSVDAGVPSWNQLLLRLLSFMIERLSRNHTVNVPASVAEEFSKQHGLSSLILAKYLKNNLGNDFNRLVRDVLYDASPITCALINSIVDLSRPQRYMKSIDSIITFNFDSLLEENLTKANIINRSIYTEDINHTPNELPIFHVHGYLPRAGDIPQATDIVFSEDAYHSQFLDPFSWSNLIQLNKLTQNTCLFIGVSLTDPNLRRLLDVAWRKNCTKAQNHYIIKKLPRIFETNHVANNLSKLLEEQDANALGINVIWVDHYEEIPVLIRMMWEGDQEQA